MVNHILSKSSKFCIIQTIRFCSNFTSMWSKYLSNNVWRDFISNGDIKYPIGESSIFAVNLLKLCITTVANVSIGSICIHSFKKCLYHMLVKCEQNCMVQTTHNIELFDKNVGFLKTIFDKALTPFCKTFL